MPPFSSNSSPSPLFGSTLVDLLRERATERPDSVAFTFTVGKTDTDRLTYAELDRTARAIGAMLQASVAPGTRALLVYNPGLEYIAGFFGCLYAGVVAVPIYPPRLNRSAERLLTIVDDSGAEIALTSRQILNTVQRRFAVEPRLAALSWIATDQVAIEAEAGWQQPAVSTESLAFLQYTSGSTGTPKGVMLSHGNLMHNSSWIHRRFEPGPSAHGVVWLPPYHDMGLIGGILQPIYGGFPCTLMAPVSFLQQPLAWLQTISRTRATISGGPNFAFDLAVRKVTPNDLASLDLSSWELAFTGAEPVRRDTLDLFAKTFAPCGFRKEAFYPCYGLAEATLLVTGGCKAQPPVEKNLDKASLGANQVSEPQSSEATITLVGAGNTLNGQALVIVDPTTQSLCPPGQIGEIWMAGPSVARGYWNKPEATQQTFLAYRADTGEGPYLRTGDLGFLDCGELFVTGRLKDLIIIRGRNHYPQDIELTAERSHRAIKQGNGAAFTVEAGGEERLVLVYEVDRHYPDLQEVIRAVRQALAAEHGIQLYGLLLVNPGGVPKTSSGKIQRHACRANFLAGKFEILASSIRETAENATTDAGTSHDPLNPERLLALPEDERHTVLESYLRGVVASAAGVESSQLNPQDALSTLGIDSLLAADIAAKLEAQFGAALPITTLLEDRTVAELADQILLQMRAQLELPPDTLPAPSNEPNEHPVSHGQQAMWFLKQLAPDSSVYNVCSAMRILSAVDAGALRKAFQTLVDRHPALQATFHSVNDQVLQRSHAEREVALWYEEAAEWDAQFLDERLQMEANRPFDLEEGPLFRVHLFRRSANESVLLITVHHIVTDFWSLSLLLQELGQIYAALTNGEAVSLPPLPLRYSDHVLRQNARLAGSEGDRLWTYWKEQLHGDLPVLSLPTDRLRSAVQTYRGAVEHVTLDPALTEQLKALSRNNGATLYMTLLAAFQAYLHRCSGQADIIVGSPAAGRTRHELAGIVGLFTNSLALRADFSANPTFLQFLRQTRATVLGALAHQDYPFPLLVERLQPERDPSRSPVFQTMFLFQKAPLLHAEGLTAFALGQAGAEINLGGLHMQSLPLIQQSTQFDLSLAMAEGKEGLIASLHYNTDLFNSETAQQMLRHFQVLLNAISREPEQPVALLPLLTPAENTLLLDTWNDTAAEIPDLCIHRLFEAQVDRSPEATAVVFEDQTLSFRELNERANRLAAHLKDVGISTGMRVGICMDRSPDMLAAILAVIKAGAAYLPLDPKYPRERLAFVLSDAAITVLLTQTRLVSQLPAHSARVVCVDRVGPTLAQYSPANPPDDAGIDSLAYVLYTSGSTGKPKGVMVTHRNVVNFFAGMDQRVGAGPADTLLAVTSIAFDISVLELFWTLTRGTKVVLLAESDRLSAQRRSDGNGMEFSLFYFAADGGGSPGPEKYRLLLEGAKFADQHGFTAVWTPERHFHPFGGLYPNPSVLSAALATITDRIQLRSGSVVLPLHHPIRVAEEWSVVDNLSNGRVALALASGWHADDFVFAPGNYRERKEILYDHLRTIQRLWQGESVTVQSGAGNAIDIRLFPQPVQPALPVWITSGGSAETFIKAGEIGANVLTHLLGQSIEEVAEKVALYRQSLGRHGHDPQSGRVALMMHTYVNQDMETVRARVRDPFRNYLRSSVGLIETMVRSLKLDIDLASMNESDMEAVLDYAYDRYFETGALFGTPDTCMEVVDRLRAIGVDEIACLVDFGIETDPALAALSDLAELRNRCVSTPVHYSLAAQVRNLAVTHLQCTPSLMRLLLDDAETVASLQSLRTLMLGGEPLPAALAAELRQLLPSTTLLNMYGPTETTIWSTTYQVQQPGTTVPIGQPIANTLLYVVDKHLQLVPPGMPGELLIGGAGVAAGYLGRPDLTAERFMQNPFRSGPDDRVYRTGDLVRYLPSGDLEFLGRLDHQVKLNGFRMELGEIESALANHPSVREAVVTVREDEPGQKALVAYLVASGGHRTASGELRQFLKTLLPEYMIPSTFVFLESMPLTANGKIDRRTLPKPSAPASPVAQRGVAPLTIGRTELEQVLIEIWKRVLGVEHVGLHDNFFQLGGHSLLAVKLRDTLKQELGVELPLTDLFKHRTISSLAAKLSAAPVQPLSVQIGEKQSEKRTLQDRDAVAIIGISCRFPQSNSAQEFWENIRDGKELIRQLRDDELEPYFYNLDPDMRSKLVPAGGFLDDIDKFDAEFFGINEKEARWMDPQQRFFLECTWEAIEDAGYNVDKLTGAVSVYAGAAQTHYLPGLPPGAASMAEVWQGWQASSPSFLASRVAYKLNLRGEALVVDTACSTSLVAVHMACQSLLSGQSDYAIAGGVSIRVPQKTGYIYEPGFIFSPDGHCRAFDKDAAGTVLGNGVGVVLLKRLSDALRDRDAIYAVIKGSAINNDGNLKIGYTAPSVEGQTEVIANALAAAGLEPDSISYVEAHGTGTRLGDPIEVHALTEAFRRQTNRNQFCAIGSVKTNIGHCDTAAGIAGLIKTALALKHKQLPPSLHFQEANPEIDFERNPFFVNTVLRPWQTDGGPRRAGVSAFGIGGTNAHVILEESPQ